MNDTNSFYRPLAEEGEMRILSLHPGASSSPVICTLATHKFSSNGVINPDYDALSYMWGSEENMEMVILNELHFPVRRNLFLALQHLRSPTQPLCFWIDALCINQEDLRERAHQVAHMSQIYSLASTVRTWLGLAGPDVLSVNPLFWNAHQNSQTYESVLYTSTQTQKEGLEIICNNPYWSRLWIIQEIVLAARIHIHYGGFDISYGSFSKAVLLFARFESRISDTPAVAICRARFVREMRRGQLEASSIFTLIRQHAAAQCQDSRDKIFGLLGMAKGCCKKEIVIDYSVDVLELCNRVWKHYLEKHFDGYRHSDEDIDIYALMRYVSGQLQTVQDAAL